MKASWIIFCKEMRRLFTSWRMVMSLYLPGIVLFIVYQFMGNIMTSSLSGKQYEDTEFVIAYSSNFGKSETHGEPTLLSYFTAYLQNEGKGNGYKAESFIVSTLEEKKEALKKGEIDLVIHFSDLFDQTYNDPLKKATNRLNFYYDGSKEKSSYCYSLVKAISSSAYVGYLENYDLEGNSLNPNVSSEGESYSSRQVIATIFPMVSVSLLFSTLISICPESVAGEKERGTLASLLLTPCKRYSIALGKMGALAIAAITSGAVSFLATAFSLPSVMGVSGSIFALWSPLEILLLFFLIASAMLLFLSMSLLISCLCKTIKEASAYMAPAMMILMMFSFVPLFMDVASLGYAFIPGLNIISSMNMLIMGTGDIALYFLMTILTNFVAFLILLFCSARCFASEEIMLKR